MSMERARRAHRSDHLRVMLYSDRGTACSMLGWFRQMGGGMVPQGIHTARVLLFSQVFSWGDRVQGDGV